MPRYSPRIGQNNSVPTPTFGTAYVTAINTDVDNLYTVGMITQAGQVIQRATYLPGCAPVPGQSVLYASDTAGNYVILGGLAGIVEKRIHARVTRNTNQTIANDSDVIVQLNNVVDDTHGAFNSTGFELIVPVSGIYLITANFGFSGNSTGYRRVRAIVDGTTVARSDTRIATSAQTWANASVTMAINKGSSIQAEVYQNSGAGLAIVGNSDIGLTMAYLGPA